MNVNSSAGYSGGCQCGAIRYHFNCQPIVAYTCHCTDCQRQSSAAFGISVWFPESEFVLEKGELSFWSTISDSGNPKLCSFCNQCGSRIYHAFGEDADTLSVKGGSLDRIGSLTPVAHIWMRSAQPWMRAHLENGVCYETEPEDFEEIVLLFESAQRS